MHTKRCQDPSNLVDSHEELGWVVATLYSRLNELSLKQFSLIVRLWNIEPAQLVPSLTGGTRFNKVIACLLVYNYIAKYQHTDCAIVICIIENP